MYQETPDQIHGTLAGLLTSAASLLQTVGLKKTIVST
jgi:hypothetical protein